MTYASIILAAAKSVGVSGSLLLAICTHETGLQNVINKYDKGSPSLGICQVKKNTAALLGFHGKESDLMKPSVNAKYAALYLKYQMRRYDGNVCRSIAAYNAGTYVESKVMPGKPRNYKYNKAVNKHLGNEEVLACNND